jgi:D-alanyl-D-alanine-carboxypeptidase/D-alanyl-D-alanine-endopeptidase
MTSNQPKLQAEIESLLQPSLTIQPHLSVSIGLLQAEQNHSFHFGTTHPPNDRSLYEIGSITKVFTAILLACLVEEGRVNLDDAVKQYLPDLPNFPVEVTLRSLATHTSGLPRLPRNMWWSMLKNKMNPYVNYRTQDLYAFLKRYRDTKRLGRFEYSNLGVGLLGHVLETVTQTPYERLIGQYITEPLNLTDTTIRINADRQQRLIPGYLSSRKPQIATNWDLPTLAGAGALRSTTSDLLSFAAANLNAWNSNTAKDSLAAAMNHCHHPQQTIQLGRKVDADRDRDMSIGLGWLIDPIEESDRDRNSPSQEPSKIIHWHNGGTGGYQSYLALHQSRSIAIVVLANTSPTGKNFSADKIGNLILKSLLD